MPPTPTPPGHLNSTPDDVRTVTYITTVGDTAMYTNMTTTYSPLS